MKSSLINRIIPSNFKFRLYFSVVLVALGFFSCLRKPLEPRVVDTIYLHQDLIDYFCSTSLGSWYAFEEVGTGVIDTMKTIRYSNARNVGEIVGDPAGNHHLQKQLFFVEYSSQQMSQLRFEISAYAEDSGRLIIRSEYNYLYGGTYNRGKWYESKDISPAFAKLDSLAVNGRIYRDVLKIWDYTSSSLYKALYFAKGIGLVRKDYNTAGSRVFNLVNWEVKK